MVDPDVHALLVFEEDITLEVVANAVPEETPEESFKAKAIGDKTPEEPIEATKEVTMTRSSLVIEVTTVSGEANNLIKEEHLLQVRLPPQKATSTKFKLEELLKQRTEFSRNRPQQLKNQLRKQS